MSILSNIVKKKKIVVDQYEQKMEKIRKILDKTDTPLSYMEIAKKVGFSEKTTRQVIGICFSKATKESSHSGFATEDFLLLGENVSAINTNFYYKIMKKRMVDVGSKLSSVTGGRLH